MTWAVLAAMIYVVLYVSLRCRPARIVAVCPIKSRVPREIEERLGPAARLSDPAPFLRSPLVLSLASLLEIRDEATLDARLGFFLHRPVTLLDRSWWVRYLHDRKWTPYALFLLALEVLHRRRPRDLVVDLRPPDHPRVARSYRPIDCAMFAVELMARVRRYSEYRDAELSVVFVNDAEAWIIRATGDGAAAPRRRSTAPDPSGPPRAR